MTADSWFDEYSVIGTLSPVQAAGILRELGDAETAAAIETLQNQQTRTLETFARWNVFDKPYLHASHTFGYIAPLSPNSKTAPIQSAGNIAPDLTLRNTSIKITLNCLRVAAYPGGGTHQILFDFYTQNHVDGAIEHLHFNSTYRVQEGERAATLNYPIFVGLNVGKDSLLLKCYTVNVKNEEDEAAIKFLESDVFKAGLKLASTAQPAIELFSEMALGLTKLIINRRKNVAVQDFSLGLDFGSNPMSARLAEGIYIAVQIPEREKRIWDWRDWVYDAATGQVVNDYDRTELIPYNYIAFGISRYEES